MSLFLIPIGILQRVLIDNATIEPGGSAVLAITGIILVLGAVCGFGAAKLAQDLPLQNGAASAALAYLLASFAALLRSIIFGGTTPSVVGAAFAMMMMATFGMFGAMLERRSRPLRQDVPGVGDSAS